jgi:signal transduction histidine kinase
VSLGVLFIGTVLPHLPSGHVDPHDPVSLSWLLAATLISVLTAALLSIVIARRLIAPVDGYVDTARRFAAGDHSARPDDLGPPEFQELASALIAAADEIERSELARRQLTADIAHELRTPLTALQAGLEELRDGWIPADTQTLAALHDQASRLGRIVNDVAELAAAESSGLHVQLEDVDLAQVARLVLAARGGSLEAAGLVVHRDIDRRVRVLADADRMHQVLGNLLANAALYCRPATRSRCACAQTGARVFSRWWTPALGSARRSCPTCSIGRGEGPRRTARVARVSVCPSSRPSWSPRGGA